MIKPIVVVFVLAGSGASAQARPPGGARAHVTYRVVESRASVRVVVIGAKDRSEARLRQLGAELKVDFASIPVVIVNVFDTERAAKMYDRMLASGGSLGGDEEQYYDDHQVAIYNRNQNTGHEQYSMFPSGARGRQIDIVP